MEKVYCLNCEDRDFRVCDWSFHESLLAFPEQAYAENKEVYGIGHIKPYTVNEVMQF